MKLKSTALSQLSRMSCRLRGIHWREPLLQAWGIVGGLLIVGIASQYGRGTKPGEKKKSGTAGEWMRPGPLESDRSYKPVVVFSPAIAPELTPEPELDLRTIANRAASQPAWKFLSPEVREKLTTLPALTGISVVWSGTHGGDAAALDLYSTATLGVPGGAPCDFVIGNGQRGGDGRVEVMRRWLERGSRNGQTVTISLIGEKEPGKPTAAQEAALGELIATLEARSGSLALTTHEPRRREVLADAN